MEVAPIIPRMTLEVRIRHDGVVLHQSEHENFPIVCGRSRHCDISLPNLKDFSINHFAITSDEAGIHVTDLNSRVGLSHKGERTPSLTFPREGVFQVGEIDIELRIHSGTRPNEAEVATAIDITEPIPFAGISAGASDDLFFNMRQDLSAHGLDQLKLQCVVLWETECYEVLNFGMGEQILISPNVGDGLYLPVLDRGMYLGHFTQDGAIMRMPKKGQFRLFVGKRHFDFEALKNEKKVIDRRKYFQIHVAPGEFLVVDLDHGFSVQIGFVLMPRPFIKKTLIENKEEIKKAFSISAAVHLVVTAVILLLVPKADVPVVPDVPPRFARLLVEPPKLALPVPSPPPPPPPPPPKTKAPEPPKLVVKGRPNPSPRAERATAPKTAAQPNAAEEISNLFDSLPGPSGLAGAAPKSIKVSKNSTGSFSPTPQLDLPKPGLGSGVSGAGMGSGSLDLKGKGQDYKGLGQGSAVAGKQKIKGAVVGRPSLGAPRSPQGLSQAEIMKVVSAALGRVQQCYERELFNDPTLAGRIQYEWEINNKGRVIDVSVKKSEMGRADRLNECVMNVIRSLTFPASKNGQNTIANIGFPFGR